MFSIITLTLSESDIEKLQDHEQQSRGRIGRRARFVLLSNKGYSAPEIGQLMDAHPQTVRRWLHRYREYGIEGLKDRPRSGRPSKKEA